MAHVSSDLVTSIQGELPPGVPVGDLRAIAVEDDGGNVLLKGELKTGAAH